MHVFWTTPATEELARIRRVLHRDGRLFLFYTTPSAARARQVLGPVVDALRANGFAAASKILDGMATFALIHGGGGSAWDWHLVIPALQEHGHDAVAVDLPSDDESAGWNEYAAAVVQAIGDRRGVVVVGHSLGGFTAPLVCVRVPVDLLVLLAAMIPSPGELFADWWANAGYEESGEDNVFYHDVSPELAVEARQRERDESSKALREPWPLEAWPDTPTRYLLCRDDRMFPAAWARRHALERLGIDADEIDGGHYITLSRSRELAERLDAFAAEKR